MNKSNHYTAIILSVLLSFYMLTVAGRGNFYVYNAANGLADNSAQTINCTKTGRLVITTMGQINFYDGQEFHYIDPTTENTYPLSKYTGHAHLYFDKQHHLWLKKKHMLTCVDLLREMFVENIVDEFKAMGMSDQVEDLFVDDNLMVWLLTEKGIYSVANQKYYAVQKHLSLQDLAVYNDQLLLFYGNGQVDFIDQKTGNLLASERAYPESRAEQYSGTSLVKRVGEVYYQIRNGSNEAILMRLDPATRKWDSVLETPYYLSSIVEHDSLLYVPSAYGYWIYSLANGEKTHVEYLQMSNGQQLLTDINAMEFDRQGGLWVGTEKRGLLYSRPFSTPFQIYGWTDKRALELSRLMDEQVQTRDTYRDKRVNCVFRDSRGWDWVGTSTGLQLYKNKNVHLPELITRREGLLNNVIHCVIEDHLHNIWVGTSYGICCLVIKDDKVRYINRYNNWDGIPSESFVNGRSLLMADGTIVMQALDHVIAFNPDNMKTLQEGTIFDIYPKLVRLFVNGNDVKTGQRLNGNVILERALTRTKEINLNYDQNSVSLTFSGLNYFRPQQTYYRVRVSGPDMKNKWEVFAPYNSDGLVDVKGQLHLPLVALKPGKYIIEVQSSMFPDAWTTTPYEWIINVNEPWWRTTGVMALTGLVLFVMLLIYLWLYMRNANMRARRNSEEQGIIKRIKSFADRCGMGNGVVLEPMPEDIVSSKDAGLISDFSPAFVNAITAVMPIVANKEVKKISMRELSSAAGLSLPDFYNLMTTNIYKNPRSVAMQMMLDRAAEMLLADRGKDIEEIASACGFVSPNYFIASFFHKYHQTPVEYRQ